MNKSMMYPPVYIRFLCILQTVFALPTNLMNVAFPPKGSFCFFTSSELVFEVIMTEVAPSAKLQGAGKVTNLYAYLPNLHDPVTVDSADPRTPLELKNVWGAVYYVAQDDYSNVEQLAYKQSIISNVMVEVHTNHENGQTMECLSTDAGLLPQAFPLPVHAKFCQEVSCRNYLDRLADVGVPQDYIVSLTMLPSTSKDVPRYLPATPLSFIPPATQNAKLNMHDTMPASIAASSNELPANKLCVFTASELIFPDAMIKVAPSATLIGAGMLMDDYIGLGGKTQSDHFAKFEGFDHIWGAAYAIDQNDMYTFHAYGQQFFFMAEVQTDVKGLGGTTCQTFDVGLLPTAFPFAVYKESKVDVQSYVKQLQNLGAPANYVSTISSLANSVDLPDPTNKVGSWVY